ncbi:MAG: uroporphyrinogen decarboxylase family protein [Candidatus Omnitrophica bacterium]|nr:uroporphyrinogen decarboxylase family protein [Candidatus Omnitrophota bacterium]
MTPRERVIAILEKRWHEGFSWTALVDNNTLNSLPEELRGNFGIDFYRHINCDILLLNGWNTPYNFKSPELKWSESVLQEIHEENGRTIKKIITPNGNLIGIYGKGSHPIKYPVDSLEAVTIYTEMWTQARFLKHDDTETFNKLEDLVKEYGVITRFWGASTIPRLLEFDMGTTNFYYLINDYPDEMKILIDRIHEKEREAFKILAQGPCNCVILIENTSSYYVSPKIYEQFNMPHQREFVKIIKDAGKIAILHMCGHVKNLLHLIKETGCDGIHALTEPPTGDTPWELALDVLGEKYNYHWCA